MTLPWAIYVRRDILLGDRSELARLITHEMVHVGQWRSHGTIRFVWGYLRAYIDGRRQGLDHYSAYAANPFEVEARTLVDSLTR